MKYLLLLLFVVTISYSQTGKITYTSILNFPTGVNKAENELIFTNKASVYRSKSKIDKNIEQYKKTEVDSDNGKTIEININAANDSIGSIYYNNLQSHTLTCRENLFENFALKFYIYEDATNIKWKLTDEFKEISNYKCQKATTTFRGRNYEAWFASEIPLSFGPWKFSGLPGLILEVYNQTGEVYFSAEQIQIPFPKAAEIVQKPSGDPLIDYREFVKRSNETSDKISKAILARAPQGSRIESTKTEKYGIELEYEWNKE